MILSRSSFFVGRCWCYGHRWFLLRLLYFKIYFLLLLRRSFWFLPHPKITVNCSQYVCSVHARLWFWFSCRYLRTNVDVPYCHFLCWHLSRSTQVLFLVEEMSFAWVPLIVNALMFFCKGWFCQHCLCPCLCPRPWLQCQSLGHQSRWFRFHLIALKFESRQALLIWFYSEFLQRVSL